jgi:hypothetical protein
VTRFQRFRKGKTAKEASSVVSTTWAGYEPDDYDPEDDGTDEIHHTKMQHFIPQEKVIEAITTDKAVNSVRDNDEGKAKSQEKVEKDENDG